MVISWNHKGRHAFLALIAVLSLAAVASAQKLTESSSSQIVKIKNFGQMDDRFFRGAQPKENDYQQLAALGIKTVIDLQADGEAGEQQLVESAGMRFHRIPMTTHTAPTAQQIATFLQLVNDDRNQPVYVHCAGGRHRTGVMTAIYRMAGEGWTAEKAFQEMKQFKFGADMLHPEFKRFVYAYQPPRSQPAATAAIATVHQ